MSWKTAPLGKLADVRLGKMLDQKKNQGEYRRYLGNDNVQWNQFKLDEVKEMRIKDSEVERYSLRTGDLLICEGGDPGRCALWTSDEEMYYQKALNRVRVFDAIDPQYLLYYFLHIGTTREVTQYYTGGATIKHLPNAALKRVEVRYPEICEQRRIASILMAYDNLIENNRRQIALLEEAAQRLYREWFVDLRFPGHEDVEIVGGLPDGWLSMPISESAHVIKGCSYKTENIDVEQGIPMVNLASIASWGGYKPYMERTYSGAYKAEQVLSANDIVMALTEQTAGLAGYVARIPRYAQGSIPSMDLACLRPKSGTRAYLYCTCRYGDVSRLLSPLANGTKIKHLKPEALGYTDMRVPPMELQQRFEDAVNPTFGCIDVLMEQSECLRGARDRLLPKLMSGEIEVEG